MEIRAFKDYILSRLIRAAALSAKYAGYTHRVFLVAYCKVVRAELVFHSVQCNERCAFRHGLDYNMMACHHVCVKAMQRLAVSHHYIIGYIYDVVYRAQAYHAKPVLQPCWAFLDLAIGYAYAGIAFAGIVILYCHLYRQVIIVNGETIAVRTMQRRFIAIAYQPCVKVARYAPVRQRVGTVGGYVNLDEPVALKVIIFRRRLAYLCVFRQHYYAIMTCAHAYFVFGAYHAVTFNATQFGFLYHKFLVAIIQDAAQVGHYNLLPCGNVRSSTYYLRRRFTPKVNRSDMQMV